MKKRIIGALCWITAGLLVLTIIGSVVDIQELEENLYDVIVDEEDGERMLEWHW